MKLSLSPNGISRTLFELISFLWDFDSKSVNKLYCRSFGGDLDAFGEQQESEAKVYGTDAAMSTFQMAKILELWHKGIRPSDDSPGYRQS